MIRIAAIITLLVWSAPGFANSLNLPRNAAITLERNSDFDSYEIPLGQYKNGTVPTQSFEGEIDRQSWRIDGQDLTTLQILAPIRSQLKQLGFTTLFECDTDSCGGFDFRFNVEVLPPPSMYVNLRDFRFLTAEAGPNDEPNEIVTVLVSKSGASGYVQIIRGYRNGGGPIGLGKPVAEPDNVSDGGNPPLLATEFETRGHVILSDLKFETGSSNLSPGDYQSLRDLAQYLAEHPKVKIALVGHTDSVGGLSGNIALSKNRAISVFERLRDAFDVSADRMEAEGMGYLAPIASNLTQAGRDQNRRVEAVLLSNE
jgi:outer membrane protein OmpA-like peptidoglycan-associated protein